MKGVFDFTFERGDSIPWKKKKKKKSVGKFE